jgi:hypothetical protein
MKSEDHREKSGWQQRCVRLSIHPLKLVAKGESAEADGKEMAIDMPPSADSS